MEAISSLVPTFLLNALWQITLVAGVAAFCARLMRNVSSARYHHRLWVAALALSVMLPLWSLLGIGRSNSILTLPWLSATAGDIAASAGSATSQAASTKDGAVWPATFLRNGQRPVSFALPVASALAGCYLLFLLYRAARLWRAWSRTNFIRNRARAQVATPQMEAIAARCRAALQLKDVAIFCSSQTAGPLTLGARRPVIILPENLFQETSEEVLASVLGHEMAHIRRRDFALNLLYEFLYLPISFHPAAALVRRQINRTRELSCDEMVAERIVDSTIYARSLVRLADSVLATGRPDYTLGVFDADILEERIMKLIERKRFNGKRTGKLLAFVAALTLGVTGVAASAFSFHAGRYIKEAADGRESAIVGTWHGNWPQNPKLPALDLTVNSDEGKLSGTIIFYRAVDKEGVLQVAGQVEQPLIDPKFDGTTLSFRTKQSKRPDDIREKAFAMRLVNDHELQLASDDSKLVFRLLKTEGTANASHSFPTEQTSSASASIGQSSIIGTWNLMAFGSNGQEAEGPGIVLKLKMDGDQLAGTAITWKEGAQGWQKVVWPLIEPKFDGNIFSFKVSNSEEILVGEMKLVGDKFEGAWSSSKSKQSGKLRLTRRD